MQREMTPLMTALPFLHNFDTELTALLRGRTVYRDDIRRVRDELRALTRESDPDTILQTAHEVGRLMTIHKAGLGNNQAFYTALHALALPSWRDMRDMDAAPQEMQVKLAAQLYNVEQQKDYGAMILIGDRSRLIAHELLKRLIADNIPFWPQFEDTDFKNLVLTHARRDGIKRLAAFDIAINAKANKKMIAIPNGGPAPAVDAPRDKRLLYATECRPMRLRTANGDMFFTLTCFPTEEDAQRDEIPYEDYMRLYFEMCDQPWDAIEQAQALLIKQFNKAETVRFTNNDGTDVTMSLVDHDGSHFTFCNSVIAKNIPGAEIFSAPRRDSVNGTIVAKGKFSPRDTGDTIIENLTMHFKDGYLFDFSADKGAAHFQDYLDKDSANRWVGELGIGTNPHLKKHVMNTLLVEKIGGSFHVALGNAYTFTEYAGHPVKVDNGNQSLYHWDITTMLIGKGGRIELDGHAIMADGKFLAPELDVLNRGWAAIPAQERPDYWKDYQGPAL